MKQPRKRRRMVAGPEPEPTGVEMIAEQLRPLAFPIAKLRQDPENARKHPARQLAALKANLQRYGCRSVLVVHRHGNRVLAGNGRFAAAKALGWSHLPCLFVEDDRQAARAFAIADNRVSELAFWDDDALARALEELRGSAEAEALEIGCFTSKEIDEILARAHGEPASNGKAEPAAASAASKNGKAEPKAARQIRLPKRPITKPGDVWRLGRHRLLCGDARDPKAIARVRGTDEPAPLLLIDPPYCTGSNQEAGKAAGTWGKIASDNLSSRGFLALMREAFAAATPAGCYVFTDWRQWSTLSELVESSGIVVRSMIVWRKPAPGLGQVWRPQHELICFGARGGMKQVPGREAFGNVIDAGRTGNVHHYTEKPVDLLERLLAGDESSERGRCDVLDTFAGSGSTILAAERRGRTCHAVEIEPGWCDIAVQRWETTTGGKAEREPRA